MATKLESLGAIRASPSHDRLWMKYPYDRGRERQLDLLEAEKEQLRLEASFASSAAQSDQ